MKGLNSLQVLFIIDLVVRRRLHIFFSQVSVKEARRTVDLWYNDRKEVLKWQEERKKEACEFQRVHTLLGRARRFPKIDPDHSYHKGHIERAAINTPVQVLDLSNTFIQ